jgi:hypothetical protein
MPARINSREPRGDRKTRGEETTAAITGRLSVFSSSTRGARRGPGPPFHPGTSAGALLCPDGGAAGENGSGRPTRSKDRCVVEAEGE